MTFEYTEDKLLTINDGENVVTIDTESWKRTEVNGGDFVVDMSDSEITTYKFILELQFGIIFDGC